MRSAGAFEVLGGMRSTHDMCCATQGNEEMQNPSNCKQSHVQAQPVLPQYLPMWNDSGREKRRHASHFRIHAHETDWGICIWPSAQVLLSAIFSGAICLQHF